MEEQEKKKRIELEQEQNMSWKMYQICLLYTSDAADD